MWGVGIWIIYESYIFTITFYSPGANGIAKTERREDEREWECAAAVGWCPPYTQCITLQHAPLAHLLPDSCLVQTALSHGALEGKWHGCLIQPCDVVPFSFILRKGPANRAALRLNIGHLTCLTYRHQAIIDKLMVWIMRWNAFFYFGIVIFLAL